MKLSQWHVKHVVSEEIVRVVRATRMPRWNPYRRLELQCGHYVCERPSKHKAVRRLCSACVQNSQDSGGK